MRDAIALFLASLAAVGILRGEFALLLASLVAMGILAADYKLSGIVRVRKTDVQTMLQEFKTLSPDARERVKPLLLKAINDDGYFGAVIQNLRQAVPCFSVRPAEGRSSCCFQHREEARESPARTRPADAEEVT